MEGGIKLILSIFVVFVILNNINTVEAITSDTWFNSSWTYKQEINITVTTGTTENNYTTPIILNSTTVGANFNWTNNLTDLRFTNNESNIVFAHWVENYSSINEEAWVWVRIDSNISTANYSIHMYYGFNDANDISEINSTFLFADDFEDSTFTDKWALNATGTDETQSDGFLILQGTPSGGPILQSLTNIPIGPGIIVESRNNKTTTTSLDTQFILENQTDNARLIWGSRKTTDQHYIQKTGSFGDQTDDQFVVDEAFQRRRMELNTTTLYRVSVGVDMFNWSNTSDLVLDGEADNFTFYNVSIAARNDVDIMYIDFIAVRIFHEVEPNVIFGEEITDTTPPTIESFTDNAGSCFEINDIYQFNWDQQDDGGIDGSNCTLIGPTVGSIVINSSNINSTGSAQCSLTLNETGDWKIEVNVTDSKGNLNSTEKDLNVQGEGACSESGTGGPTGGGGGGIGAFVIPFFGNETQIDLSTVIPVASAIDNFFIQPFIFGINLLQLIIIIGSILFVRNRLKEREKLKPVDFLFIFTIIAFAIIVIIGAFGITSIGDIVTNIFGGT